MTNLHRIKFHHSNLNLDIGGTTKLNHPLLLLVIKTNASAVSLIVFNDPLGAILAAARVVTHFLVDFVTGIKVLLLGSKGITPEVVRSFDNTLGKNNCTMFVIVVVIVVL